MINLQMMIHTHGNSPNETIREYISVRYERWADYSRYHCSNAGISDESIDVLNEVLSALLEKDPIKIKTLLNTKKGQYTDLDFYVLRMIKLNVYSETSPYRHKNKPLSVDREVKVERLNLIDEDYVETDRPAEILKQTKLVRWVFSGLQLTIFERYTFERKFFMGETMEELEWHGAQKLKYGLYQDVLSVIHNVLYYYNITNHKPQRELTKRQLEIAEQFIRTHKIQTLKSK